MKYAIAIFVCISLILSSCNTEVQEPENPIFPTNTRESTTLPASSQTASATAMIPSTSIVTPTIYVTTSNTNTPNIPLDSQSQKLVNAMLTRDDVMVLDSRITYRASIQDSLMNDNPSIIDASAELNNQCLVECTKQIWVTPSREVLGFGENVIITNEEVVIIMLRSKDEEKARNVSESLYQDFMPFDYEYDANEYTWVSAPTENTYIGVGIANKRRFVMVTTSRGTVTLLLLSYPSPLSDDGMYEIGVAADFTNLQLRKLEDFGLIPPCDNC